VQWQEIDSNKNEWTQVPGMSDLRINFSIEVIDDVIFTISRLQDDTTMNAVVCNNEKSNK
jgi:hypothetical protein